MKKIVFIGLSLAVSLSACNAPVNNTPDQINQLTSKNNIIIDLAKDQKNSSGGQVTINLNDKLFNTKTLPPVAPARIKDIKAYKIGLCTDPANPTTTAVAGSPKIVLRDGALLVQPHTITLINVPAGGPYYAVVQAMGSGSKNITENNISVNNIDAYVSTNSVTVNSDFTLSPASTVLNVTVNLMNSKPGTENFNFTESLSTYLMPSLSVNASDKGISAWVSTSPSGFSNIYAQKIQGFNPIDTSFLVSTINSTQIMPSVSINNSGNGLLVWAEVSGTDTIIKGIAIQNYDISGNSFLISSLTGTVQQINPSVNINSNGDGVVVWEDYRNSSADIYGRKIINYLPDASGDFRVDQSIAGLQQTPKVSVNSSGTGIVTWIDKRSSSQVYYRKLSAFIPNGSEVIIDSASDYVSMSADDSGNGMIAWKKDVDIFAAKLSNFIASTSFKVSDSSGTNKSNPEVSINSSGFGMVIWEDFRENSLSHIYGKEIKSYAPFGANDMRISSEDGTNTESKPVININSFSNGVALWSNNSNQLKSRHIIKLLPFNSTFSNLLSGKLPPSAGIIDGPSSIAQYNHPEGMSVDTSGNIYVADTNNHRIRKILPDGSVTTFAGSTAGFNDGPNTGAKFNNPEDVAIDTAGNIYVADSANSAIRKISTSGVVTTVAGSLAGLVAPKSVTVDLAGNLYVADSGSSTIKKITNLGVVTTIAGSTAGYSDGIGTNAKFNNPLGIDLNKDGNLYVTDTNNNSIRKINLSDFSVSTFAGTITAGDLDGFGTMAKLNNPTGITTDSKGFIYISDFNNHKIKKISPSGYVSTIAGSASPGFANGDKNTTRFNFPTGVALREITSPNYFVQMYVSDWNNNLIRVLKVD